MSEAYQQRTRAMQRCPCAECTRPSASDAQLAELRIALAGLLAYVNRSGGYMSPEDQILLRAARAVLERGHG